jgi:hypothetical protein
MTIQNNTPDINVFYDKTKVSTETLASSTSWTQMLEVVDLYSDHSLQNKIGYKVQNSTNGTNVYQYTGTLYFGNEFGSVTFVNGDENTTITPNVGQIYLDRIAGGKKDFILADGIITTTYPIRGNVVAVSLWLNQK